ncbi:MAG TPA: PAS domain-containing sensor histidine kinase [Deltaproteobacteria bacterium]|nr:PAS domain-containing sensor histidine kinase [Deltaproteobacteria bacterium]
MEKARAAQKIFFEFRHRLADGSIRNVEVYSSKIEIKGKGLLHSIIHDATERKRMEEALREKEIQYRALADLGLALIWTAGTDKLCNYFNQPWLKFTGRALEQELGNGWTEGVHPEDLDRCVQIYVTAFDKREAFDMEYRLRHVSGEYRWIRDLGTPNYNASGEFIGYIGHCFDITEQKTAEAVIKALNEELEQRVDERTEELHKNQLALLNVVDDLNENATKLAAANEALEALNRELEAFAYSVSHDLRAPLRSIDGFSAALLEDYKGKLDATGKNYLERVRNASQHMAMLIDDILKLSRVVKADFRPEPVNLSEIAREIAANCKKAVDGKAVTVKITKDIVIEGDKALLEVALTNLIDNAFKFSGKQNNPLVEFGVNQKDGKNVFFVRDNGVGFDMTYASKLFAPFQRLHNVDEFPGTGVGLATVQRIINRHGGIIWAESEVNKGATFFFTIPGG